MATGDRFDALQRFTFDNTPVRGETVSIQSAWQHIVGLHAYPQPVRDLLGQMLAAAALLSSTLKFDGALVMQLHVDGDVPLLVCECHADLGLRATAKIQAGAEIADGTSFRELMNREGRARMAITLDPRDRQPGQQAYQGIVPVEGDSIAEVLEGYMLRSEQIETRLWLAADERSAAGMLLQRLPPDRDAIDPAAVDAERWSHLQQLADTLKDAELLELPPVEVVRRLFWDDAARVYEPRPVRFVCSCSLAKVGAMLEMLGRAEIDSVLEEFGEVRVNCEYCNTAYVFDAVDVAQLFADAAVARTAQASGARH
ncbi:Hsp33 family molecular chaperone HslO [soil metagenome]